MKTINEKSEIDVLYDRANRAALCKLNGSVFLDAQLVRSIEDIERLTAGKPLNFKQSYDLASFKETVVLIELLQMRQSQYRYMHQEDAEKAAAKYKIKNFEVIEGLASVEADYCYGVRVSDKRTPEQEIETIKFILKSVIGDNPIKSLLGLKIAVDVLKHIANGEGSIYSKQYIIPTPEPQIKATSHDGLNIREVFEVFDETALPVVQKNLQSLLRRYHVGQAYVRFTKTLEQSIRDFEPVRQDLKRALNPITLQG